MIYIDGIIYSLQRHGGISVYFNHLLNYLTEQNLPVTLTMETPLKQIVSGMPVIHRAARTRERYQNCRVPRGASLFHSSYYRQPDNARLPTVITVHDFISERFGTGPVNKFRCLQQRNAIKAAQSLICISEATKQDLLEYVGVRSDQSVHVIHNGVSSNYHPVAVPAVLIPFVLFIGKRHGYKNFRQILQAMEFLPDFELLCVGGGPFDSHELTNLPDSVSRRIRRISSVDDEALNILYNQAVCLAYPSKYEGFGIPVIEAMRAGCPVVSVGCKAVLAIGGDALTVAVDDPRGLADAILKTVSSDRASLIAKGLIVAQAYSWEKTHTNTVEVYRSLGFDSDIELAA